MGRRRLFADELSDIPELMRGHAKGAVQGRFERCLKCGHADRPVAGTGLCSKCGGRQSGWRNWHPSMGQPVYHGEHWIPVSQLPSRRYG
jgi:hypothetical protein